MNALNIDLKEFTNYVTSKNSSKILLKRIKKNKLIREGYYDLIMSYYNDIDIKDSILEIVYRIINNIEEKPKCPYCGKPCTFDQGNQKYDDICGSNSCISNHLKIELPNDDDINDEYIINLLSDKNNQINPWYLSVSWLKRHGVYNYIVNRHPIATSLQESTYMIFNHIEDQNVPLCKICHNHKVRFVSLKEGYSDICDEYRCSLASYDSINTKNNITDQDIIDTFIIEHDNENIIKINKARLQKKWICEHGYEEFFNTRYKDSESPLETVCRIFYHIEERPVCKNCGKHVNLNDFHLGKDNVFRQYCCNECANSAEECLKKKRLSKDLTMIQRFLDKGYKCEYIEDEFPREHLLVYDDCKIHNPYKIRIGDFYNRHWKDNYTMCPICNPLRNPETSIETIIKNILEELNVEYVHHCRTLLKDKKSKEVDFYLPQYQLAIECNDNYWHSGEYNRQNGLWKYNELKNIGIQLMVFWEDDIRDKTDIVKNIIKTKLGKNENIIFARKCEIKEVSSHDSREFIEKYHIQGNINASVRLGLYYNDELIEIMTFGKLRKSLGSKNIEGYYELYRLCTKDNTTVVGGASKLFKYFIKEYKPINVISYCHKEISNGNVYEKLGMTLVKDCRQGYSYFNANVSSRRINRFSLRKDKVDDGSGRSESEILESKGYLKCYDLGSFKFEYLNISV